MYKSTMGKYIFLHKLGMLNKWPPINYIYYNLWPIQVRRDSFTKSQIPQQPNIADQISTSNIRLSDICLRALMKYLDTIHWLERYSSDFCLKQFHWMAIYHACQDTGDDLNFNFKNFNYFILFFSSPSAPSINQIFLWSDINAQGVINK